MVKDIILMSPLKISRTGVGFENIDICTQYPTAELRFQQSSRAHECYVGATDLRPPEVQTSHVISLSFFFHF